MKTITHVLTGEAGLHARPAGKLVKLVKDFDGKVEIGTEAKMVDCKRIMGVMGLSLKQGDTMVLTFDGSDEDTMAEKIQAFLKEEM